MGEQHHGPGRHRKMQLRLDPHRAGWDLYFLVDVGGGVGVGCRRCPEGRRRGLDAFGRKIEQAQHLVVVSRREVPIVVADGGELARRRQADYLVRFRQVGEGLRGGNWNGQDHPGRALFAGDPAGHPGGGAGGDPVVDDYRDASCQVVPGPALPEQDEPVFQRGAFVLFNGLQFVTADP